MSRGALIGPEGLTGEVINEQEHQCLKACLAVIRDIPKGPMSDALEWIEMIVRKGYHTDEPHYSKVDGLVLHMIEQLTNRSTAPEYFTGVLLDRGIEGDARLLEEGEAQRLDAYLKVLRMGGWFADWLVARIGTVADEAKLHPSQYPTPLETMRALGQEVEEFECANQVVSEMLERFPQVQWTHDLNDRGAQAESEPPSAEPTPKPRKRRKAA